MLCWMWNFCGFLSENWKTIKDETEQQMSQLYWPAGKRYKFIGNEIKL